LRKEIKSLREASKNNASTDKPEIKAKEMPKKSLEEVTKDPQGNVQVMRLGFRF